MVPCLLRYLLHKIWNKAGICSISFLFAIYLNDLPTVILLSIDLLLFYTLTISYYLPFASSISELQQRLHNCEKELSWVDVRINEKSGCSRIGPRFDVVCAHVVTTDGHKLT